MRYSGPMWWQCGDDPVVHGWASRAFLDEQPERRLRIEFGAGRYSGYLESTSVEGNRYTGRYEFRGQHNGRGEFTLTLETDGSQLKLVGDWQWGPEYGGWEGTWGFTLSPQPAAQVEPAT